MESEMKFCQSCGMPLTQEILGTNADGSKNEDYCMYCQRYDAAVFPDAEALETVNSWRNGEH